MRDHDFPGPLSPLQVLGANLPSSLPARELTQHFLNRPPLPAQYLQVGILFLALPFLVFDYFLIFLLFVPLFPALLAFGVPPPEEEEIAGALHSLISTLILRDHFPDVQRQHLCLLLNQCLLSLARI